jgi:hypothetical protein
MPKKGGPKYTPDKLAISDANKGECASTCMHLQLLPAAMLVAAVMSGAKSVGPEK